MSPLTIFRHLNRCNRIVSRVTAMSSNPGAKKAAIFLAPGAEEMEFVIAADVLRRAGVEVTVAGVPDKTPITCSRGVIICPDASLSDLDDRGPFDALVLPGGLGGAKTLSECEAVGKLLGKQECDERIIAAICAAPTVLKTHGIGIGKKVTSYPSVKEVMTEGGKYEYREEKVVVDGNLITSRGPGTAYDFALALVRQLVGEEKACEIAKGLLYP